MSRPPGKRGAREKKTRKRAHGRAERGAQICRAAARDGIHGDWAWIWKAEGTAYVKKELQAGVATVFVDEQILLMKSTIPEGGASWAEYVERNFGRRLVEPHRRFETVILAFNDYEEVPVYKSIEQERRVATGRARAPFAFKAGDQIPARPPRQDVWAAASSTAPSKTTRSA